MSEARRNADWPIVTTVVVALLVVPLCVYVVGYLALPETLSDVAPGLRCRVYRHVWQVEIYKPAAGVESLLTGVEVEVASLKEMADYP